MKPADLADALRRIASGIENSKNPSRHLVANDLASVLIRVAASFDADKLIADVEAKANGASVFDLKYDEFPDYKKEITDMWPAELEGVGLQDAIKYVSAKAAERADIFHGIKPHERVSRDADLRRWNMAKEEIKRKANNEKAKLNKEKLIQDVERIALHSSNGAGGYVEDLKRIWPEELNGFGLEEAIGYCEAKARKPLTANPGEAMWRLDQRERADWESKKNAWNEAKNSILKKDRDQSAELESARKRAPSYPDRRDPEFDRHHNDPVWERGTPAERLEAKKEYARKHYDD